MTLTAPAWRVSDSIDAHAIAVALMREALSLLDPDSVARAHLERAIAAVEQAEGVRVSDGDNPSL